MSFLGQALNNTSKRSGESPKNAIIKMLRYSQHDNTRYINIYIIIIFNQYT
jgi:hypothetical protein